MADPLALARRIADALEAADLPYAIGGALALGYWAPPRGTADVDLNIFVDASHDIEIQRAFEALATTGVVLDQDAARHEIAEGGVVRGWVDRTAVDTFFDSIELHRAAAGRTVSVPLAGRPANILSAEDLIVLKLLFFRGKDLLDVEQIVATQGSQLDHVYVRTWLVRCMGADDERVDEWDRLTSSAR